MLFSPGENGCTKIPSAMPLELYLPAINQFFGRNVSGGGSTEDGYSRLSSTSHPFFRY